MYNFANVVAWHVVSWVCWCQAPARWNHHLFYPSFSDLCRNRKVNMTPTSGRRSITHLFLGMYLLRQSSMLGSFQASTLRATLSAVHAGNIMSI